MADENAEQISQEMILKADKVFNTLNRLNTEFTKFGETVTKAIDGAVLSFDKLEKLNTPRIDPSLLNSLNAIADSAKRASDALDKVGRQRGAGAISEAGSATKRLNEQTNNWLLSMETLGRVIQTQLLVRTLNTARDVVKSSYEDYLKFSKSVSEIHAVDQSRSFAQIAANVSQQSNQFNQPLAEVSEAQYQTISNQFVTAKQQSDILTAANQLAKTSCQDLGKAVELVAGSLNAYGESSEMAGLRAAQFDKTIALGHMRMEDLGAAMGRIQPLGRELGVSIEELQASLISLSIGGLKSAESATQVRGILTELLKPTEAMKLAFAKLGVESGAAGIATYGFQGFLEQLTKAAGGQAQAMATLFPNVRGLSGEFRLAGAGAESYAKSLRQLAQVTPASLGTKVGEINQTPAEQATRELNKLANFFKTDFGAGLVTGVSKVTVAVDPLVAVLSGLTQGLPVLAAAAGIAGAAWIAYAIKVRTANAALREQAMLEKGITPPTAGVLGQIGKGALAVGATYEVGTTIGQLIGNGIYDYLYGGKAADQEREAAAKTTKALEEQTQIKIKIRQDEIKHEAQTLLQHAADVQKSFQDETKAVTAAARAEEDVTKQSLDHIMQARQKMAGDYRHISEEATKKADETLQEKRDANQYEHDMLVRSGQDARSPVDINEQERRAQAAQTKASELLANAKDPAQEKTAAVAQQHADAELKKYVAMAEQSGKANELNELERTRLQFLNQQAEALEKQQALQRGIAKEAEARAIQTGKHNQELEADRKTIEDALKITTKDDSGNYRLKTQDEYKKDEATAQAAIKRFNADLVKYGTDAKGFMNDPQAFKAMQRDNERILAGADLQQVNAAPARNAELRAQLQKAAQEVRIQFPEFVAVEKLTGKRLEVDGIYGTVKAWTEKRNEQAKSEETQKEASQALDNADSRYWKARGQVFASGSDGGALQEKVAQLFAITDKLMANPALATKANVSSLMDAAQTELPSSVMPSVSTMIDAIINAKMAKASMTTDVSREANTDALKANTDAILLKTVGATKQALGGFLYRDGGGDARGTDTIPAMLSPGEMVINAASSRKFYSQLVAMNAGSQPAYRQDGGSVTNVGDVSITVQESKTPQSTARELMQAFRREIRRGSSTL